jgi:hypothetical protein
MKKLLLFMLAAVMALSLTACGGKDTGTGGAGGGTPGASAPSEYPGDNNGDGDTTPSSSDDEQVNINNWQEWLKENRNGFDLSVPDGWTVTEAKPEVLGVTITFEVGGDVTEWEFGKTLFNESQRVAFVPVCEPSNYEIVFETYEAAMKNGSEPEKAMSGGFISPTRRPNGNPTC